MRAVVFAVASLPEGGATSVRLRLLANMIAEANIDVEIGLLNPTNKSLINGSDAIKGRVGKVYYEYLNGRAVRPTGVLDAFVDTIRGIYGAIRILLRKDRDRPDFVILYTPNFWKFCLLLFFARLWSVPLFMEACEIRSYSTDTVNGTWRQRLSNSADGLMERVAPNMMKGIFPISTQIRDFYLSLGAPAEKILLIPALVDVAEYSVEAKESVDHLIGKTYLFNSGKFLEKDGVPYIIDAFDQLAEHDPDVLLVFSGDVPEAQKQRALDNMSERNRDRVVFTGFLSREELIWCYQHAAALLCCRSNSVYANFGFPTKLGEYLASGAPVIATAVGDVPLYLKHRDSALLANSEDSASIKANMEYVLQNRERAREIGRRGQQVAWAAFDYRSNTKDMVSFIKRELSIEV